MFPFQFFMYYTRKMYMIKFHGGRERQGWRLLSPDPSLEQMGVLQNLTLERRKMWGNLQSQLTLLLLARRMLLLKQLQEKHLTGA